MRSKQAGQLVSYLSKNTYSILSRLPNATGVVHGEAQKGTECDGTERTTTAQQGPVIESKPAGVAPVEKFSLPLGWSCLVKREK